ncbi:MAG: ribonuclease P protein component [bacterium]|nr:ribonuclease P protein component [bacterium]
MERQTNNFETLKKELDFNLVFKKGKTIKSEAGYVKAAYLFVDNGENWKVKTAIAIPSKSGNSVWRNRFKRLIRESVRRELKKLTEIISKKDLCLLIVFSPNRTNQRNKKKLFLYEVHSGVTDILKSISSENNHN